MIGDHPDRTSALPVKLRPRLASAEDRVSMLKKGTAGGKELAKGFGLPTFVRSLIMEASNTRGDILLKESALYNNSMKASQLAIELQRLCSLDNCHHPIAP